MIIKFIPNVLDRAGRTSENIPVDGSITIRECFEKGHIPEEYAKGHRIITSRYGYLKEEEWGENPLYNEDEIIVTPDIRDPISLTISAVAAFTTGLMLKGVLLSIAALASATMFGFSIYTAIKGAKEPDYGDGDSTPTYGWDGVSTTASQDIPVPVVYGTHRVGGNVVDMYITCEDTDDGRKHFLNLLLALSEGPVYSIGGITSDTDDADISTIGDKLKIEGNPISNYNDITVAVRLGNEEQTVIPGFSSTHNFQSLGEDYFIEGGSSRTYTTIDSDVEELVLHISFPSGIYYSSERGVKTTTVKYRIEYKLHAAETWTDFGETTIISKMMSHMRRSHTIPDLTAGQYDIRITKTLGVSNDEVQCDMYLTAVDEIVYTTLTYPYTALVGLKVLATDQLSGSIPQFSIEMCGRLINVWNGSSDTEAFSNNPIWCMREFIENARYGLGGRVDAYSSTQLDYLQTEADYCDADISEEGEDEEKRFELDFVIDKQYKALDLMTTMCATFRCLPFWSEGMLKPLIAKIETPVQLFTMGNIIKDSFTESFTSRKNKYNMLEVQYWDRDNDNERDCVMVVSEAAYTVGDPITKKSMQLPGITRTTQATKIATYYLKVNQLSRAISYKAGIDSVACQPGDVINFAHDVPAWGVSSGRIKSSTNNTFTPKNTVVLSPATTYYVKVRIAADDTVEEKLITSAAGTYVGGTAITISGTWTANPSAYDVYTVGTATTVSKPFRIIDMTLQDNNETQITALEYSDDVFDMSDTTVSEPDYSELPDPRMPPPIVTNLVLTNSNNYDRTIYVSYTVPEYTPDNDQVDYMNWDHAEIWYSIDGGDVYHLDGTSDASSYRIINTIPGREYYVKVVSVSKWGVKSAWSTSPTSNLVAKVETIPPDVKGLELKGQANDTEFTTKHAHFTWKDQAYTQGDKPAGDEDFGAGEGTHDSFFQDYRVEIWVSSVRVREEYVVKNEYIYAFEKNVEDNTTPARSFEIRVWARDQFNQQSTNPALLTVSNPQCATVTGLTATASFRYIFLTWTENSEVDLYGYVVQRSTHSGFAWDDSTVETIHQGKDASFTDQRDDADPATTTYYYRVGAYDTFGTTSISPCGIVSATTAYIETTDIDDFAFDASKMFMKIVVLESETWTNDSPGAGSIAWNQHNLYYNGECCQIAAGNTDKQYIYWKSSFESGGTGTVDDPYISYYTGTDTHPGDGALLGDDGFIIATNIDGAHDVAWNAVANQVIGSAWIMNACINTAKIALLAVDTAQIADAAITNIKVSDLSAEKINAGFLAAGRIDAGSLAITKMAFDVAITFHQDSVVTGIPTSINAGDLWSDTNAGNEAMYLAAIAGADEIGVGEWEVYADAGEMVNAGSTRILPGQIVIDGGTYLSDWRHGSDLTQIDGGDIYANTVTANKMVIGSRNLAIKDLIFTYDADTDKVGWTAGEISYIEDTGSTQTKSIDANAAGTQWTDGTLYIYWVKDATALSTTTDRATAFGLGTGDPDTVVLASYAGGVNLVATYGKTQVDGSEITTGSVTATQITGTNLSAIYSDLGTITAGSITLDMANSGSIDNRVRLDDTGLYVTQDGGANWRRVIGIDNNGLVNIAFDSYNDGDIIPDIMIREPTGWTEYYDDTFTVQINAYPADTVTDDKTITQNNQGIKVALSTSCTADPEDTVVATIRVRLYETNGGDTLIYEQEFESSEIVGGGSYDWDPFVLLPCSEGVDFFPSDIAKIHLSGKYTGPATSITTSAVLSLHTLGYVQNVYKTS